jgi:hypothetical protein
VPKNRDLNPGDPFPADQVDALNEFLGTAAPNFRLQVRTSDPTVLEVPGGAGDLQSAIAVAGRWRYNTATVSRGGVTGAARSLDVHVTASDNSFAAGVNGETDNTVYGFGLAITETGVAPTGVALSRKVGTALWDGTKFGRVVPDVGWVTPEIVPAVTTLPASPYDGQKVALLSDPSNAAAPIWEFRYRAASTSVYKWEFVGGGALQNDDVTGAGQTGQTWVTGNTPLTVPRAGDYMVEATGQMAVISGLGHSAELSVGTVAGGPLGNIRAIVIPNDTVAWTPVSLIDRFDGVAAGAVLTTLVRCGSAGQTISSQHRSLKVTPLRVI